MVKLNDTIKVGLPTISNLPNSYAAADDLKPSQIYLTMYIEARDNESKGRRFQHLVPKIQ